MVDDAALARPPWCRTSSPAGGSFRSWMVRNGLDPILIDDRLRTLIRRAGGHDPELRNLASGSTGPRFNAAGVDALVIREIELRIHGTFCREVRPLLARIRGSDDHESSIGFTLQTQSHVVEHSLRSVVDAPRLRCIREFDLVDLACLRRRRRRRRW